MHTVLWNIFLGLLHCSWSLIEFMTISYSLSSTNLNKWKNKISSGQYFLQLNVRMWSYIMFIVPVLWKRCVGRHICLTLISEYIGPIVGGIHIKVCSHSRVSITNWVHILCTIKFHIFNLIWHTVSADNHAWLGFQKIIVCGGENLQSICEEIRQPNCMPI